MKTIYILKLENNKYYVGITNNINKRILNHFTNTGSEWTKKYKPIEIINEYKGDNFDEEKYTLLTMDKYGIDNVRGGSYCIIELSNLDKNKIKQIINSITDKCYKCSMKGHYAKECEKIQLLNNHTELEKYIRIKLGQIIFPTPEYTNKLCIICKKLDITNLEIFDCVNIKCTNYYSSFKCNGHLRFDFDAQDDKESINNNNKILELFNDFYKDKKCVVHSHEGSLYIKIVSNEIYDTYYQGNCSGFNDEDDVYNFTNLGTVEIIINLLLIINSNKLLPNKSSFNYLQLYLSNYY